MMNTRSISVNRLTGPSQLRHFGFLQCRVGSLLSRMAARDDLPFFSGLHLSIDDDVYFTFRSSVYQLKGVQVQSLSFFSQTR